MTFTHVAVFTWAPDVDRSSLGEQLSEALMRYVSEVAGVVTYQCGPDARFTEGAADFVVVGIFASRDAFLAYRDHERHKAILASLIQPNLASRAVAQLQR